MITSASTVLVQRAITPVKPSNYQSFTVPAPLASYTIEGLTTGQPYHVIVSGASDRGIGPHSTSVPALLAPMGLPAAPLSVELSTRSGTSLLVAYEETAPANGGNVTKYKTEWDISPNFDSVHAQHVIESPTYAVQKVTVAAPTAGLSGTFTLSYGDYLGDFTKQVGGLAQFVTLNHGSNVLTVAAGSEDMRDWLARGDFVRLRNEIGRAHV